MKTQIENLDTCRIKLTLEFGAVDAAKAYGTVIRELGKEVKIPGFMPGKVPKSIIEERVGKNAIQVRAVEKLVSERLPEAITAQNLDLISRPVLDNSNFDFENTLNVSVILELRPEVKLGKYEGVEVSIPKSELKDVSVDSLLKDLAKRLAPLEEVADAKVQLGDVITIDFVGKFLDGSEMPDPVGKDIRVVVQPENFAPNVMDSLVGSSIGETKEITTKFPEDYPEKSFANKEAQFTVTINKVERQEPLPIDEDLAVKAGRANLEELQKAMEEQMVHAKTSIERSRTQALVLSEILAATEVDIPDWLVEREAKAQLDREHQTHHHEHGEDCNHEKPEPDEEILAVAKNKLKFNLVLAQIAREQKIQITQPELSAYMQAWNQMRQMSGMQGFDPNNVPPGLVNHLAEELLFEKITDWLINKAKVESVPETEETLKKLEEVKKSLSGFLLLDN